MEVCRANNISLVASNDIKMPNFTNTSWTLDIITAKDIIIAIIRALFDFYHRGSKSK